MSDIVSILSFQLAQAPFHQIFFVLSSTPSPFIIFFIIVLVVIHIEQAKVTLATLAKVTLALLV